MVAGRHLFAADLVEPMYCASGHPSGRQMVLPVQLVFTHILVIGSVNLGDQ